MKFEIDTEAKTIVIEGQYTFAEIEKELKKMIPDWKQYKLTGKQPEYSGWTYPYQPISPIYTPPHPDYGKIIYWGGLENANTFTTSNTN